jgi:hypothetical protein
VRRELTETERKFESDEGHRLSQILKAGAGAEVLDLIYRAVLRRARADAASFLEGGE